MVERMPDMVPVNGEMPEDPMPEDAEEYAMLELQTYPNTERFQPF